MGAGVTQVGSFGYVAQVDADGNVLSASGGSGPGTASAGNQTTQITAANLANTNLGGVTEAAPATDTASSGLNGRLQRIAQRLTSLIALFPTSLGAKTGANSFSIVPNTDTPFPVSITPASTGTNSSVASGVASVTLLTANASRKGATITNTDANALYVDLSGGTASTTSYTVKVAADGYYEVPYSYTGLITGIWAADGAGAALVTQFT